VVPKECFGKIEGNCFRIFEGKSGIFVLLESLRFVVMNVMQKKIKTTKKRLSDIITADLYWQTIVAADLYKVAPP